MNQTRLPIDIILVPKGAEYKAVQRGLKSLPPSVETRPEIMAVPVGPAAIARHLTQLQQSGDLPPSANLLMMGLCGSLSDQHGVGDRILYQDCVQLVDSSGTATASPASQPQTLGCDPTLTTQLRYTLGDQVAWVRAFSSDRLIWSAQEKRQLGQQYRAEVVDMEGAATLATLNAEGGKGYKVAMVRVVSDDCHHDLPNIDNALSPDGNLRTLPLALGMMRQPIAASRLIRGSLKGLEALQQVTVDLFGE